jgi:hypothetical protein
MTGKQKQPEQDYVNVAWYRLKWRWLGRRVQHARYGGCSLWLWREADGVDFGNWGVAVFGHGQEFVSFHHAWSRDRAQWKCVQSAMFFRDGQWPEF